MTERFGAKREDGSGQGGADSIQGILYSSTGQKSRPGPDEASPRVWTS